VDVGCRAVALDADYPISCELIVAADLTTAEKATCIDNWIATPAPVIRESVTQAETSDTVPRIDSLNSLIDSLNSLHKSGNDT
jgi:hypothetical protein